MPGPRTAELKGLNWQVQVDPLTLSITSLPPTLPVFAAVDEVLDELPPQAVANMHTAPNNMSHLKRFIDTLRSPSTIASWSLAQNVCSSHLALRTEPTAHQRRRGRG